MAGWLARATSQNDSSVVPAKRNDLDGRLVIASEAAIVMIRNDMPKRNGAGIELLADPTRRRIIALLALGARRPSTLAADIGLSRPATTRQLRLLRSAGLVRVHPSMHDGRVRLYDLEPRARGVITAWLAGTEVGRPFVLTVDEHGSLRDG